MTMMRAIIYDGKGGVNLKERNRPRIEDPTDAIVKIIYTTICGTDLHILGGHVPSCKADRVLGHEGVGVVDVAGPGVKRFKEGDKVLISCISSCATCKFCRKGMYSHCELGGWCLGHTTDGTQAEYTRIPLADSSLYPVPENVDLKALVMLSDILPTGLECGVLNGRVQPGCTVAIIGAGPVGLSALITAQLYSPSMIICIDKDPSRLEVAKKLGATMTIEAGAGVENKVKDATNGMGVDTAIEAVGFPATLELAQDLVAAGGTIANIGVHGESCNLKIDKLWGHNITLTTRLVDTVTTPMLLRLFASGNIRAKDLITHDFKFGDMEEAYSTFKSASKHNALKMLISME
ncbi:Hypothetical protein R9X50_00043000 [Acrodontium crateriforme]|uniref:Enoyl reductase (ER) domain-containing protein n=1 Tax=Acrodontium crateriforme TaxID=150365 RepID=A0AAQ3R210_9PEZI|nr:Hypothetical protein R9X50_00043000 [Acrodontium crateriforme]